MEYQPKRGGGVLLPTPEPRQDGKYCKGPRGRWWGPRPRCPHGTSRSLFSWDIGYLDLVRPSVPHSQDRWSPTVVLQDSYTGVDFGRVKEVPDGEESRVPTQGGRGVGENTRSGPGGTRGRVQ